MLIAAGTSHSLVIAQGLVHSFGCNKYGALGLENEGDIVYTPTLVPEMDEIICNQVVAGDNFSMAVSSYGELYAWGLNEYGILGIGSNDSKKKQTPKLIASSLFNRRQIKQISCGKHHVIAQSMVDDDLYAWGDNSYGQLSLDTNEIKSLNSPIVIGSTQLKICNSTGCSSISTHDIISITCGAYNTFLITRKGHLYSFGENYCGQLGIGTKTTFESIPTRVEGDIKDKRVIIVAASRTHTLAIVDDNIGDIQLNKSRKLFVWGDNSNQNLGLGDYLTHPTPTNNFFLDNHRTELITCGDRHSVCVSTNKHGRCILYVWGDASLSGKGKNAGSTATGGRWNTPIVNHCKFAKRVTSICAGEQHTLMIADTKLYAWGYSTKGQAGSKNASIKGFVTDISLQSAPPVTPGKWNTLTHFAFPIPFKKVVLQLLVTYYFTKCFVEVLPVEMIVYIIRILACIEINTPILL